MRLPIFRAICWLLLLGLSFPALATHQVGGQIEMRAVSGVPGKFKIIVTNYLEDNSRAAATRGGTVGIFRKRDNLRMMVFTVSESDRQQVVFSNEACAIARNIRFVVVTFEAEIQLSPSEYADGLGYYMSFQTQNRNAGINNISNPDQTGFTFYLEFPPVQKSGQFFANSSPRFGSINGEYICVGDPFTFPFGATDPDGDELRYSLVTPLDKDDPRNPTPGPYPDVRWLSGFGATNAIPGSPSLSVDEKTGQLSVTASELGLFVFAVKVEEYRAGQKIGEVRREFQFLVVDCPPVKAPTSTVWEQNHPTGTTEFTVCKGKNLTLQTTVNPAWNYQWQRDGINLPDATGASLGVQESGAYSVVISFKTECGKASSSQSVKVTVVDLTTDLDIKGQLCAADGSVTMTVPSGDSRAYQWYLNGQAMAGQVTNALTVAQPGQYSALLTQTQFGCTFQTTNVPILRAPAVQAVIQATTHKLCPGSSLPLTGSGGASYAWQQDGQTIASETGANHATKTPGSFVITATAANGCKGVSAPFVVEAVPGVDLRFTPVSAFCGTDHAALSLAATPAGGVFAGTGVSGDQFDPQRAGLGEHVLTYTVVFSPDCPGAVATQTAVVAPIPTIQFPEEIITSAGSSLTLNPELTGNPVLFTWTPTIYLANSGTPSVSVENIEDDTTYTLRVENAAGCKAESSVHITVYERIWVPDAFSPNGDGVNDIWSMKGVEAFPTVEVTVYNRWGEVVYWAPSGYKEPFDGRMKGKELPPGAYVYTLRYDPRRPLMRGMVMLLR
ncbi:gliding motility-associated C-terminal domain-containing protein [Tellurirhabdus bombi]|uniref:gliding motility-associated C-terminal domain-containing protein n=1 Tax=Tellurirhabdus bombi TaxID=2907205 RepID=UPI001F1FF197|nr:gliding motility-associated C-terminal domain-containing protein [Tellurirhabdus bombi]